MDYGISVNTRANIIKLYEETASQLTVVIVNGRQSRLMPLISSLSARVVPCHPFTQAQFVEYRRDTRSTISPQSWEYGRERTAPSKTTDRLSSVSLLMGVESNSGAADARASVTWPSAEVAARLNPLPNCLLCSRVSTRESSNWVTASWHRFLQAERSWVWSPGADGSMPHCFRLTFRASLYRKTGPQCRRFPAASCPRNTCLDGRTDGRRGCNA